METVLLLPAITPKTGLTAANLDDDPPVEANMVALGGAKATSPVALEAVIIGENAAAATLTGAWWFGIHARHGIAVAIAPVNEGYDVSVSTTKGFRQVLTGVLGVYTHLGLGKGTLSANTVALHVHPLEVQGD
jgi:hypothetical protein